jgi:DNA replication protein DnaC
MPEFDGYSTHTPELAEALQAAKQFCADMVAEADRVKCANRDNQAAYAAEIDAGRFAAAPQCHHSQGYWLSLLGKSGAGKTHLAKMINEWRKKRTLGRYFYPWGDLVSMARDGQLGKIRDRVEKRTLMIIDDIGTEYETDFSKSLLAEIAEKRLDKWTVFTANLTLKDIAAIDSRIASRMIRDQNKRLTFENTPDFALRQKEPL